MYTVKHYAFQAENARLRSTLQQCEIRLAATEHMFQIQESTLQGLDKGKRNGTNELVKR